MKVDFVVLSTDAAPLMSVAGRALREALVEAYEEPGSEDEVLAGISIKYAVARKDGRTIYGLRVDFDVAYEASEDVIAAFARLVRDSVSEGIDHIVKLADPSLQQTLHRYATEIYEIEMGLREALSVIFLDRETDEYYDLLHDTEARPKKHLRPAELRTYLEDTFSNEFFLLLFSDYRSVNDRRMPNSIRGVVDLISRSGSFAELQRLATSDPIERERYVDFLAAVKEFLEPVERVRNCVAHNRPVMSTWDANYQRARSSLKAAIDEFLGSLATSTGGSAS